MFKFLTVTLASLALVGCSKGHCGKCAKDGDCGSGLACDTRVGACKNLDERRAEALVCPADCTASNACGHEGRCSFKNGECVVGSESDCLSSPACVNEGRCHLYGGECMARSDDDCRKASWCHGMGLCKLDGWGRNKCVAGTNADCKASVACSKDAKCFKNGDWCAEVAERPNPPTAH
jgi:hypothetical protein